jgi:hypothetical protein
MFCFPYESKIENKTRERSVDSLPLPLGRNTPEKLKKNKQKIKWRLM